MLNVNVSYILTTHITLANAANLFI